VIYRGHDAGPDSRVCDGCIFDLKTHGVMSEKDMLVPQGYLETKVGVCVESTVKAITDPTRVEESDRADHETGNWMKTSSECFWGKLTWRNS
jgi:hypothetical protein